MQDKEGAMKWVDTWLERHGPEEKRFGIEGIDWSKDVGYEVGAEEETKDNRRPTSSRTKPKKGVWIVELKNGLIQTPAKIKFNVVFEMYLDPEDSMWAGNPLHFEKWEKFDE
eukprot:Hpha_TRINITY_DN16464_c2_g5::TRINITY_DN16464_c2_g5_i1::g.162074::m.162074